MFFFSVCVSVCLGEFLCMCGSVVLNSKVTFFLIVFVCVYVYTYLCMFVYIYMCVCVCLCVCVGVCVFSAWCFHLRTYLVQGLVNGYSMNQWEFNLLVFVVWMVFDYLCLYIYHHHHHVMLVARISLTLSRHFSGRSSGLYPVSSHSYCIYVRTCRPAFDRLYVGIPRSTSLMSLSLLLQQCPACLVRLAWIVFVMEGRWQYSWCLVGCCRQDFCSYIRVIYVYVSSVLLSLGNLCSTRPW